MSRSSTHLVAEWKWSSPPCHVSINGDRSLSQWICVFCTFICPGNECHLQPFPPNTKQDVIVVLFSGKGENGKMSVLGECYGVSSQPFSERYRLSPLSPASCLLTFFSRTSAFHRRVDSDLRQCVSRLSDICFLNLDTMSVYVYLWRDFLVI